MKYGIRDNMLRAPFENIFTVAKELGFDGIEYCIGGDYADSLLWQADGPEKLKAMADKDGVEVASLSPGVFASLHPAAEDSEKRAEGIKIMTHVIEICPRMDTKAILAPMFPADFNEWPDATWQMLIDGLKPLAEITEKHEVVLALETMFNADQMGMVVDKIDSPYVKVYYDTGNLHNRGYDVPAELRQLGDRIGMIHAKDTDGQALGDGKVDFKGVRDAIHDIGYDGYIVLETPVGDDANADNAKNLAFVKRVEK